MGMQSLADKHLVQIDSLLREIQDARDETHALRECLEKRHILTPDQFLAQLHKRQFERALERHPCQSEAAPSEVMHNFELFRSVMRCAGARAARVFSASSRLLHRSLQVLPPRLYLLGGSDSVKALSTVEKLVQQS